MLTYTWHVNLVHWQINDFSLYNHPLGLIQGHVRENESVIFMLFNTDKFKKVENIQL